MATRAAPPAFLALHETPCATVLLKWDSNRNRIAKIHARQDEGYSGGTEGLGRYRFKGFTESQRHQRSHTGTRPAAHEGARLPAQPGCPHARYRPHLHG